MGEVEGEEEREMRTGELKLFFQTSEIILKMLELFRKTLDFF